MQGVASGTCVGGCSTRGRGWQTLQLRVAGFENAVYEGPLRLRLPVSMQLDADGAFSFEAPLPSPSGNLGKVVRRRA